MNKLWVNGLYYTRGGMFDDVQEVLDKYMPRYRQPYAVEFYGLYDRDCGLGSFWSLANYGSRDTILAFDNGKIYSTPEELKQYEEENYNG